MDHEDGSGIKEGGIEENFCGDKNVHNLDWGEPSQGYTGQNSNYTL